MTELERQTFKKVLSEIKPIPGFNSQRWLRKVRTQIYNETKDMTPEQRLERERRISEEFQAEIKRRRAELAAEEQK